VCGTDTTVSVCVFVVAEMVSRISGPIPPHPCYEKLNSCSQTYIKVPTTGVQRAGEQKTTQEHESLCLELGVEGHAMPSAYKQTSLCPLSLLFFLL